MKLPRRQFLHLAVGAAALPDVSRFAWAQTYPARPVQIIVGYPPGGATDAIARLIAQRLSDGSASNSWSTIDRGLVAISAPRRS